MMGKLSPVGKKDVALMGVLVAALTLLITSVFLLMVAAALTTVFCGGGWHLPGPDRWIGATISLVAHPGRPGDALGPPWQEPLTGNGAWYWIVTLVVVVSVLGGLFAATRPLWQRFGPVQAGHASRADIDDELTLNAARRTAEWTRPDLTPEQRRSAPLVAVAAPLHRSPLGIPLGTPLENPTGTLAPTQTGKSRRDLVHKALGAPGALLCSTTKSDLLLWSALARTRSHPYAPVLAFDATGTVPWPAQLYWSPIQGCADVDVAYRRADTMVEAASVGLKNVQGNDKVFRDRAKIVLQCYLIAAARSRGTVTDLVRWALSRPVSQDPVKLLHSSGLPEYARNLRQEIGMVAETSDAVWMSVRRVIEPLLSPRIRAICTPAPGHEFNAENFIRRHGSLYLIAGQNQGGLATPFFTALAEYWLSTAQDMALRYPTDRHAPPATALFDELTNATPIPLLPQQVADTAGRGVIVHWGAQSLAALESAYGSLGLRALLDNTTTLSIWGGIKDSQTLQWASTLTGHHEKFRHQEQSSGLFGQPRVSVGVETVPTYRPGDIRKIRRGRVLILHRHLDPVLARTVDVKDRPDWALLRDDRTAIRNNAARVSSFGLALAA